MSPRAREALEAAELVLAEDTRRAGLLCQRLGVSCAAFESFHEHNEAQKMPHVLARLQAGERLALITDAGTPLVADPGYHLVRACRSEGVPVTPVPGPSAVVTALMASGLPPYPYVFLGFLPRKSGERTSLFASFAHVRATLGFYERKDRAWPALQDAFEALGPRECCIARELTKTHEEFILGRLDALAAMEQELRGEVTVLVGPPERGQESASSEDDVLAIVAEEQQAGGSPKDVARRVKARCHGWSVKAVYALMQRY